MGPTPQPPQRGTSASTVALNAFRAEICCKSASDLREKAGAGVCRRQELPGASSLMTGAATLAGTQVPHHCLHDPLRPPASLACQPLPVFLPLLSRPACTRTPGSRREGAPGVAEDEDQLCSEEADPVLPWGLSGSL